MWIRWVNNRAVPDQNCGQNYHQYVQVQCTVAVQSGTEKAPSRDAKSPFTLNVRHHFDRDHPSADIDTYGLNDWVVKEQKRVRFADAEPKHRRKKGLAPRVTIKKG